MNIYSILYMRRIKMLLREYMIVIISSENLRKAKMNSVW